MCDKRSFLPITDWFDRSHNYSGLFPKSFTYSRVADIHNPNKRKSLLKMNRLYENSKRETSSAQGYDSSVTFFTPFKDIFFGVMAKSAFNSFLINADFSACHAKICLGLYQTVINNKNLEQ